MIVKKNISTVKPKTLDEVEEIINNLEFQYDPNCILAQSKDKLKYLKSGKPLDPLIYKAVTLNEFQNGVLLVLTIPEEYRTFAIDLLRKLQKEFNCSTTSEQATAELITVNYIRTLNIQSRIYQCLDLKEITDLRLNFLSIMSKELDRANRHYLTALQTLRMLKQPSLQVNIKTNTAIVGNNQLIQENQNVNPK